MTALPAIKGGGQLAFRGLKALFGNVGSLNPLKNPRILLSSLPIRKTARQIGRVPTAGLVFGEVAFRKDILFDPIHGAVSRGARAGDELSATLSLEFLTRGRQLERQVQIQGLQRRMAENAARLAAGAPDIYETVLAGRRLPKDATVIGGSPRVDLLEQLALDMSLGRFKPPESPDRAFLREVGAL